jgi:endoglucanase
MTPADYGPVPRAMSGLLARRQLLRQMAATCALLVTGCEGESPPSAGTAGEKIKTPAPTPSPSPAPTPEPSPVATAAVNTLIGFNLAGGAAGESVLPGSENTHYQFPNAAAFDYLAAKVPNPAQRIARIDFRWERLQPVLGGPLDPAHLQRLKDMAVLAQARGIKILWNMHNYARRTVAGVEHIIGGPTSVVTRDHFFDAWMRIAAELKGLPATYAYGIMNEPHDMGMPGHWAATAQGCVDAIARVDVSHLIYVSNDGYSSARFWQDNATGLPLKVPAGLAGIVYEAHLYNDYASRLSGTYSPRNFDLQMASVPLADQLTCYARDLNPFLQWLQAHNQIGAIGECGVPDNDTRWVASLSNMVQACIDSKRIEAVLPFAYAPWFGADYEMQMAPRGTADRPQMKAITDRTGGLFVAA